MKLNPYQNQASLLLQMLPEVGKEDRLALSGGTAINLFIREMPRLSVDIDLTYIPIEDRQSSLKGIKDALTNVKINIQRAFETIRVDDRTDSGKLYVVSDAARIKIEVNLINRGVLGTVEARGLCTAAQEAFQSFTENNVIPFGQLFGSKLCAALDRQHPRDLFDVRYLLDGQRFSREVMAGLILALISNGRPTNELLDPNNLDQMEAFNKHFVGMAMEPFSYEDFEDTRDRMLKMIRNLLTKDDREFIVSICRLDPRWDIYRFHEFPAVQWKLQNLRKLLATDPSKYTVQLNKLESLLG
ncbi:MAG: nucleotidyl transferase AbiEii/AbiGii toxin family protein [Pyrinomonadaceae bacterium]